MISEPSKNQKKQEPPDWLVENIAEASKNARRIYLLYGSFLAYCAVTVAGTSDRQIILNETARLPLLNVDVSLTGFFTVGPLAAIFFFIYLQLYVTRIKGLVADLRTNYGQIEKRRLYPWILNIAEDPEPGFIGRLQRGFAQFSLWWLLPMVLMLFAFWFVKKHDPILSYVVGALPILGTLIVLYFWCHYEDIQYKSKFKIGQVLGFILNERGKTILASIVLIFEIFLLLFIIPWAMKGGKYDFLKPWICVDLSYQVLVTKPEEEYPNIYWLDLRKAHLEGADLTSAILKRADLRDAYLRQANMSYLNLEGANLMDAELQGANLWYAELQGVDLRFAELQGAVLPYAKLQGANLMAANLQGAKLWYAELQGVDLTYAKLQGAVLRGANLQGAVLRGANLQGVDLENAKLQGANLWQANLQGAVLRGSNFEGADLRGSNFEGADLRGADLRGIYLEIVPSEYELRDLTGLLSKAKTLYEAEIDSELRGRLEKNYSHLLEPPKD